MTIIDRRVNGKNKSVSNRQKFLKRYKSRLKRSVDRIADTKGITDVLKDRKVTIDKDSIEEPNFNFDLATGERDMVFPGNKTKNKGDKIYRDDVEESSGSGDGEDNLDEFTFTLTKEEFLNLYFSNMELPDFIKESLSGSTKHKWKRTGYSKDGIPPRLDLVKTLKQAMARRLATRQPCDDEDCINSVYGNKYLYETCNTCGGTGFKLQRYLDDIDLRYKHFTKQPFPIQQATMICLMDVSGSMEEFEKNLAKKFFLLLFLFLHKNYKSVELIFVSHTTHAEEVTEHEFFYSQRSGGTVVSSGLQLVNDIIDDRINLETTNVYIAQASDGDNWQSDDELTIQLVERLLDKVQYFAYIQTEDPQRLAWKQSHGTHDLMSVYKGIADLHKNLQVRHVTDENEVYPVLRSLFEEK